MICQITKLPLSEWSLVRTKTLKTCSSLLIGHDIDDFLQVILSLSPIQAQDEGRNRVRESLAPSTAQMALQRILPFPCRKQYTVVILMPQLSRLKLLKSFLQSTSNKYGHNPKVRLTHQIHLVCQFFYFWCSSQIDLYSFFRHGNEINSCLPLRLRAIFLCNSLEM